MTYHLSRHSCECCIPDLSPCTSQLSISIDGINIVLREHDLVRFAHYHRPHANMENEIQRIHVTHAQVNEAQGGRFEGMHLELNLELWGTLIAQHQLAGFTCMGVHKHGCFCACACNPIHWILTKVKTKNQVRMELDMYFNNLTHIATHTDFTINVDTMH